MSSKKIACGPGHCVAGDETRWWVGEPRPRSRLQRERERKRKMGVDCRKCCSKRVSERVMWDNNRQCLRRQPKSVIEKHGEKSAGPTDRPEAQGHLALRRSAAPLRPHLPEARVDAWGPRRDVSVLWGQEVQVRTAPKSRSRRTLAGASRRHCPRMRCADLAAARRGPGTPLRRLYPTQGRLHVAAVWARPRSRR